MNQLVVAYTNQLVHETTCTQTNWCANQNLYSVFNVTVFIDKLINKMGNDFILIQQAHQSEGPSILQG